MKKSRIIFLVSNVIAIILEALPLGAVCNFASPEETITQTYSYFSLTPYGYANFGPFITAILSCVLFIFAVILFTSKAKKVVGAAKIIALTGVITSLLPLIMLGLNYFNFISFLISVLMTVQLIAIIKSKKEVLTDETE